MRIRIQERAVKDDGFEAHITFDDTAPYAITVTPPFDDAKEKRLQWYYEDWLEHPLLNGVVANEAAKSVVEYGETLFNMLFADSKAYAKYVAGRNQGVQNLRFEIMGSSEFHQIHWEALRDPDLKKPLAIEAQIVRKSIKEQTLEANVRPSPTLNVLVVTARPRGRKDVGYRTISRPLLDCLKNSDLPVRIDILRPGTYKALVNHLDAVREGGEAGFYHIIHFDVHGALLEYAAVEKTVPHKNLAFRERFARDPFQPYDGKRAYLAFADEEIGKADLVEANELAELLIRQQIPIAILNACQSAMQEGATDTSLASQLMTAGVQVAVAMAYSVTVSAAELMMPKLYEVLLAGKGLEQALRTARQTLHNVKERRAYFNQKIRLEDWLLPVVYQNADVPLTLRPFTPEESATFYQEQAEAFPYPQPQYGFFGRDVDILEIETRLLTERNVVLVRGMGGTGKTTLLQHLGA